MARRGKAPTQFVTYSSNSVPMKTDELAEAIAKAVGKELRAILKEFPSRISQGLGSSSYTQSSVPPVVLKMDDSIIPVTITTGMSESNLANMGTEETTVDKDLKKSQSKLKKLLKKRKE